MQRPYRTQEAVRRALLTLYDTSPDGYPGNDDLGTLSAWYVFGALGLYPEVPGVGLLAIGSPLFARAEIRLPAPQRALITATAFTFKKPKPAKGKKHRAGEVRKVASARPPPLHTGVRLDGHAYGQPWTTYCALARGATLAFQLGPQPQPPLGRLRRRCAASFGPHRAMPKSACKP